MLAKQYSDAVLHMVGAWYECYPNPKNDETEMLTMFTNGARTMYYRLMFLLRIEEMGLKTPHSLLPVVNSIATKTVEKEFPPHETTIAKMVSDICYEMTEGEKAIALPSMFFGREASKRMNAEIVDDRERLLPNHAMITTIKAMKFRLDTMSEIKLSDIHDPMGAVHENNIGLTVYKKSKKL